MFPLENNAEKSVKNFKTKVQEITKRSHNLNDDLITQVNRIVRGTANYFTENKMLANRRTYRGLPPASVQARSADIFRHCRIK